MNRWSKFVLAFVGVILIAAPVMYYYRAPLRTYYRQVVWKADQLTKADTRSRGNERAAAGRKFDQFSTRVFQLVASPGGWIIIVGFAVIGMVFVRGAAPRAR